MKQNKRKKFRENLMQAAVILGAAAAMGSAALFPRTFNPQQSLGMATPLSRRGPEDNLSFLDLTELPAEERHFEPPVYDTKTHMYNPRPPVKRKLSPDSTPTAVNTPALSPIKEEVRKKPPRSKAKRSAVSSVPSKRVTRSTRRSL